ncbi:MAG TPA: insulinase family protein, partial [Bacteroidota bacterium]
MMRFCSVLLAALLMLTSSMFGQKETPPEGGKPKDFSLPKPTTLTLDNGVRVTLVRYGTLPKVV